MFPKKHFEIVEKNGVEPYIFRRGGRSSIELQILKILKNNPNSFRIPAIYFVVEMNGVEPLTLPFVNGMLCLWATIFIPFGGDERSRTVDPLLAKQVL